MAPALLRDRRPLARAQGLADLAAILDPGCFVIGGGVSEAGDLLLGPARAAFATALTGGSLPAAGRDQARASSAPDAGLIGAADLARQRLNWQTTAGTPVRITS